MGMPLRSASTMSLPEGASCESVLLGHLSGPGCPLNGTCRLHIGLPSSDGASVIKLIPPSFWASSLSWASPLRWNCVEVLSLHLRPRPHLSVG